MENVYTNAPLILQKIKIHVNFHKFNKLTKVLLTHLLEIIFITYSSFLNYIVIF